MEPYLYLVALFGGTILVLLVLDHVENRRDD